MDRRRRSLALGLQLAFFRQSEETTMNRRITLGVASLTGALLGAAAVQVLHAQAKPPAFNIAEITVTNEDGYNKEYLPAVVKLMQDSGGKFIVRGGKPISVLGAPPAQRVVVIQFESLGKAQAWANSPATKAAFAIGQRYATFHDYQVEGISP
jgi:uncharacterized protein (DUF1330 family)